MLCQAAICSRWHQEQAANIRSLPGWLWHCLEILPEHSQAKCPLCFCAASCADSFYQLNSNYWCFSLPQPQSLEFLRPLPLSPLSHCKLPHFSSASGCQQCLGGKFTRFGSILCTKAENHSVSPRSAQTPVWRQHHSDQSAPKCPGDGSSQPQLFHSHSETATTVHKTRQESSWSASAAICHTCFASSC